MSKTGKRIFIGVAVLWLLFVLFLAHIVATNEQNAARRYWGQTITGKITGWTNIADNYNVWSYDFAFTGRNGKEATWTTLLRPDKKKGDKITLWQATDGNVFVRGSFVTDHKWSEHWWRKSPWPVTQGTYLWALMTYGAVPIAAFYFILRPVGGLGKEKPRGEGSPQPLSPPQPGGPGGPPFDGIAEEQPTGEVPVVHPVADPAPIG